MSAKIHGSYSVRIAVAMALGTVAVIAVAPQAQAFDADTSVNKPATAADTTQLEEVTVTGSRIRRKDLTSSSPLITVDAEQLESQSGLNLESYLNQLPNYNPARTPTTENSDVQPSAVNTVGISTISLRGFGANRSLVLVDGHRTTPVNALMVTDINGIPSSMIDRIEIITGGASAVYGADALGGVTNFILKKNYQGASVDIQDSIAQAGDGNELRVSALMGSKIADGRGNLIMGLEYYNRDETYQKNHSFFTNSWNDPNTAVTNSFFATEGQTGIAFNFAAPTVAAINTVFGRPATNVASPFGYSPFGPSAIFGTYFFNPGGSIYTNNGPIGTSNRIGPTSGNGFGLQNVYDPAMPNNGTSPTPNIVQTWRHNDVDASLASPQTRYSFFANGEFDITDKVQFYTNARFADSLTDTRLSAPPSIISGWNPTVPYNQTTDSPILPGAVTSGMTYAQLQAVNAAFLANPTSNAYSNPNFIPITGTNPGHPVPWQLALLLNSRNTSPAPGSIAFGGPNTCNNSISPALCTSAPSSWSLWWLPYTALPARTTIDTVSSWQIETGLKFPLEISDWTGELYYSRGQSLTYNGGYGNESLQRLDSVIASPGYGQGQNFQGNFNNSSTNFGTSVPSHCTSGYYNSIFSPETAPSADCFNAINSTLQTYTQMEQDIVEANFQGTLFKLPAGDVSAAVGYQYRRDAGQFTPDNLQATNSFLDQTVGLYPLGTLQAQQIAAKDGYMELFVPLLSSDSKFFKKLNLDIGGRYSSYSTTTDSTTFKVNLDATLTNSLRVRGGYNRATRAPNLGELYLGEQEYFGGGAQFGDPCSLRGLAPFGAGGAAPDTSVASSSQGPTHLASGQTAAGATSTYLICQAQMGALTGPTSSTAGASYYGQGPQGQGGSPFAWLNEQGSPTLKSETADTWTGGIVFAQLSDSPWISGFSGSVDWWQVNIKNAIELENPDTAAFQCYGAGNVTTIAEAQAQAATLACQNVGRNLGTGAGSTVLLSYANSATIGEAGIDIELNWIAQLSDLGLKNVPGAITFTSQSTVLDYFRTKNSPANFDVNTNWKDSSGPTLAGTDGGAYGYRINLGIGYVLPSFGVNLRWRFLPSVNTASHAAQQAIIANNAKVAAGGAGTVLSYVPDTTIAAPSWNLFDLSASWTINKTFSLRGGIDNLLDKDPVITGATTGHPAGTNLSAVCPANAPGCVNPTTYSLPSDGAGSTNAGFYDVYGRVFWLGAKAQF